MAKKSKQEFCCSNCGHTQGSWVGKCPQCDSWNTMEELVIQQQNFSTTRSEGRVLEASSLDAITAGVDKNRIITNDVQLNQLLGDGFVRGSVVLLAGQPGIGKSTLLMQIAQAVSASEAVLYVSGEESLHQVASRAERLGVKTDKVKLASSNSADDIAKTIVDKAYAFVIVDSIQTVASADVTSAVGSLTQIVNSTRLLTEAAKNSNTTLVIVGHVTKEGSIAGPKLLEHTVDVVLQLEGDRYGGFKLLRSVKNRYGSTNETAIYEMNEKGLHAVNNPSALLLKERQITDGSVVLATMEGTRPLLVEIQSLVNTTVYGYPKRAASGISLNRLNLLVAMLERRTKLKLADKDIYVNVVGGIDIDEPAADLAVCMSIASAAKGMQLKKNAVVFGELGLGGEVRHVPFIDKRTAEAKKMGFEMVIGPKSQTSKTPFYYAASDVRSALNSFLEKD